MTKHAKETIFMALVINLALPFTSELVDVAARCSMCNGNQTVMGASSFHSFSAICPFLALLAFSFLALSYYRSIRICMSFPPQDSRILIFLVEFVAVFLCYDEILLWYLDVFSDEVQSFCSTSSKHAKIKKVPNLNKIQELE